ncbi:AzlD domain-containing protein [soil metagenome]
MTNLSTSTIWLTILGMGVITFGLRYSFIALSGRLELPPTLRRALRFVPAAVLSALVLPALVYPGGELFLSLSNDRLVAGLIALVVAWKSKSILLTLVVGMVALWLLQLV